MIKHSIVLQHVQTKLHANKINISAISVRAKSDYFEKKSSHKVLQINSIRTQPNENKRRFLKVNKPLFSLFGVGPATYIKTDIAKEIKKSLLKDSYETKEKHSFSLNLQAA